MNLKKLFRGIVFHLLGKNREAREYERRERVSISRSRYTVPVLRVF